MSHLQLSFVQETADVLLADLIVQLRCLPWCFQVRVLLAVTQLVSQRKTA